VFAVLPLSSASAQTAPIELGVDMAAVAYSHSGGSNSFSLRIPSANQVRAAFPVGPTTTLEPRLGLTYVNTEGSSLTAGFVGLGVLLHMGASTKEGLFVRPQAGFAFASASGGGGSASQAQVGLGVGNKFPIVGDLGGRVEAVAQYAFENNTFASAFGLMAQFGFSFYTR
jgi:hypothetical protein